MSSNIITTSFSVVDSWQQWGPNCSRHLLVKLWKLSHRASRFSVCTHHRLVTERDTSPVRSPRLRRCCEAWYNEWNGAAWPRGTYLAAQPAHGSVGVIGSR